MKQIFIQSIFLLTIILVGNSLLGQPRNTTRINDGWTFTKDTTGKWDKINLPHTWNDKDVMDDAPGYYRGVGWYKRMLIVKAADKHKELFLEFEGVNQRVEVYVNGRKAGAHTGGYTAFQFPISAYLDFSGSINSNEVLVKVDNSHDLSVPPLTADFTFFGGIYRDVWLVSTNSVHFSMSNYSSNGLFISTPAVNEKNAVVDITGVIDNAQNEIVKVEISTVISDKAGRTVSTIKKLVSLAPRTPTNFSQHIPSFAKPHLWSPSDPYLYSLRSTIKEVRTGKTLDEIAQPLGFRWFRFDADSGFFLNGKPLKLVGASRHQDRPGIGNAVPDALTYEDILALKKMGANFLRVAHYPQDPSVMEACDKLGLLASVEIPVVNEITESETFYNNCDTMLREMIRQNYNHPSVVIWCYMNEVLLRPHFNDDKARQKIYFSNVTKLARRLDSICRLEDPYRYTMIANHGDFDRYKSAGLTDIPMIVGWNLYSGWYSGTVENFAAFLDKHHQQLPGKPMVVSEYGADADPRIRSFQPVRFDKSVEYAFRFHQYYFQEMLKRPFVNGAMIWNLADFNSETREETMPHINNKGLLMWDRTPKDLYYFYQAMLVTSPFIKIASSYWTKRTGLADSTITACFQPMQVATNLDSVELWVNGRSLGWKQPGQGFCEWTVPFINGLNRIEAKGLKKRRIYSDSCEIQFLLQPYWLRDTITRFNELHILLGANRYFLDDAYGQVWQPAQAYRAGSWGYTGGQPFKLPGNTRLPYGTDKNIIGTSQDPVYQTQQVGINSFRFDVPDGEYEVTLHFAEIEGIESRSLIYNLSDSARKEQRKRRVFDVYANEQLLLGNFDIAGSYGVATPVDKVYKVTARNDRGIQLFFKPLEGKPVLNAIELRKLK